MSSPALRFASVSRALHATAQLSSPCRHAPSRVLPRCRSVLEGAQARRACMEGLVQRPIRDTPACCMPRAQSLEPASQRPPETAKARDAETGRFRFARPVARSPSPVQPVGPALALPTS